MGVSLITLLRRAGLLSLTPGLVDAGLGSLAGLAGSYYAARYFDLGQLGLFSVYFVLFQLLGIVSSRLLMAPVMVAALDAPVAARAQAIRYTLLPALTIGGLTALLVWLVPLVVPGSARADYIAFGATTAAMIVISPIQDNARVTMHMAQRPNAAVAISAMQFGVAVSAIVGLHWFDIESRWVPFLSLSVANASSVLLAIGLARRGRVERYLWPNIRQSLSSGSRLLPSQILRPLGGLGAAVLVSAIASTDDLGAAEASRVVVSPIFVMGTGLGLVLSPRIMEAARRGVRSDVITTSRLHLSVMAVFVAVYLGTVGWSHDLNVLEIFVPLAFVVPGLVILRGIATASVVAAGIPGTTLVGLEDHGGLLVTAIIGLVLQLGVAAALAVVSADYAVPAAELAGAAALLLIRSPRAFRLIKVAHERRREAAVLWRLPHPRIARSRRSSPTSIAEPPTQPRGIRRRHVS